MLEGLKNFVLNLINNHPGQSLCTFIGVLLALLVILLGFWSVIFIIICGGIGMFIGSNMDKEGDLWENIRSAIPHDIHRWR